MKSHSGEFSGSNRPKQPWVVAQPQFLSGGYQALFRFELPACYHPNLGIFWGVWLFQKTISSKIKPYPGYHFLKIQWKIHFLTF